MIRIYQSLVLLMPVRDMDPWAWTTIRKFSLRKGNRHFKVLANFGELKQVILASLRKLSRNFVLYFRGQTVSCPSPRFGTLCVRDWNGEPAPVHKIESNNYNLLFPKGSRDIARLVRTRSRKVPGSLCFGPPATDSRLGGIADIAGIFPFSYMCI
jgi:hypothetical protein